MRTMERHIRKNFLRRRKIGGVKWHDIIRKGRAAWLLSRSRKCILIARQTIELPKKCCFYKNRGANNCESEISSLLSDATTQMDEFGDDDLEAYQHDFWNEITQESDGTDVLADSSCIPDAIQSKHPEIHCECGPKRARVVGSLVALDCEMVGGGPQKKKNLLARCAVLDEEGQR